MILLLACLVSFVAGFGCGLTFMFKIGKEAGPRF